MHIPTVDIIVPVWNNPFETRACLAAILEYSPEARLIIVDNGSNRETELMLEEFSEPLGERGLFIKSDRNVGLVPAINMGLNRSDSDVAVIVRPHVMVRPGWLQGLLDTAAEVDAAVVTPCFSGVGAPALPQLAAGCTVMETCRVSFSTLLLRTDMRMLLGNFDEGLDGGEWCLREYVHRVAARGYRTAITAKVTVACGVEPVFGSEERRREAAEASQQAYVERWGDSRHYLLYFGKEMEAAAMAETMETIQAGARLGQHFTLLLHRRQAGDFRRMGWNGLHTSIELKSLPLLAPQRALLRTVAALYAESPDLVAVHGAEGIAFPGERASVPVSELLTVVRGGKQNLQEETGI